MVLAVNSIIHSKTFDNGMICASEQSVIVLDKVYDAVKDEFAARGCYFLNPDETDKRAQDHPDQRRAQRQDRRSEAPPASPRWRALTCLRIPRSSSARSSSVELSEEFAHEKLSPVLAMYRAADYRGRL